MKKVPRSLQTWFKIHFLADMLFGLPLLFAPLWTLELFGLSAGASVTARLVGAALIGIGGNSLLMNKKSIHHYKAMLDLKVLWSGAAIIALSLELYHSPSPQIWAIWGIFIGFSLVWNVYRARLR